MTTVGQSKMQTGALRERNRIRITVAFADADNFGSVYGDPPLEVRLLRDVDHASFVNLPLVPAQE